MRLISFTAKNFRRFVQPTSIKLHSDLVALIGPNEAGKSSILHGLALLGSNDPFSRADEHRRSGQPPELAWGLQLEDVDRDALASVPEAAQVKRVVVTKQSDGSRGWNFYPNAIVREREPRSALAALIMSFLQASEVNDVPRDAEDDFVVRLQGITTALEVDSDVLDPSIPQSLAEASAQVDTLDLGFDLSEVDEGDESAGARRGLVDLREQLARELAAQSRRENAPHPANRAAGILDARLPRMVAYTQEDRDLRGSYELEEVADSPPRALFHLHTLAKLDLVELRQEIREGLRADIGTRRDAANRTLRQAFDKSWNQQKVALQVEVDGSTLYIHAISLDAPEAGLSDLTERSEGMRWFASLLAFVHGWGERPILLVDEIETHLHYDAQADLVNVLGRQEFTAKVIYTTHSFGCLPPDIGNGIRLVEPIDQTTSRLSNGFWRNGVGFSPLLTSMGAAAVSFTPSRHAVIVEGPSDAILLPTLLRQASNSEDALRFQVVPGVAEVAAAKAQGLTAEAGHVAFLVDGDEGGLRNLTKLVDGQVERDLIVVLQASGGSTAEPLETEDLIDPDIYAAAVNDELACWNDNPPAIMASEVGSSLRTKSVQAWCVANKLRSPDKIAVAERVIDASIDNKVSIYAATRQDVLLELHLALTSCLGISSD